MKISQILTEIYSQSNSYMKRYLRDAEFDPYEYWWYVAKWIVEEFGLEEFNELVGENFDEDDFEEADPELFSKLSDED